MNFGIDCRERPRGDWWRPRRRRDHLRDAGFVDAKVLVNDYYPDRADSVSDNILETGAWLSHCRSTLPTSTPSIRLSAAGVRHPGEQRW